MRNESILDILIFHILSGQFVVWFYDRKYVIGTLRGIDTKIKYKCIKCNVINLTRLMAVV